MPIVGNRVELTFFVEKPNQDRENSRGSLADELKSGSGSGVLGIGEEAGSGTGQEMCRGNRVSLIPHSFLPLPKEPGLSTGNHHSIILRQ